MVGRRKNPQNLWLLLVVPFLGVVGWIARRWLWRNKSTETVSQIRPSADKEELGIKDTGKAAIILPMGTRGSGTGPFAAGSTPPSVEVPVPATGHALKNKPEKLAVFFILLIPFLIIPVAIVFLAFRHIPVQSQPIVPNGNVSQGQVLLESWGCGSCHTIPGVTGATGKVGPALDHLSDRSYIAGHLQNTPENMIQWIMNPQEVSPGVDMPDSNVPEGVARDMAAYLYSLH